MHKNRRITLHQKIGKGIKFNYITSKITLKNVSGIQNVFIYVGTVNSIALGHPMRSNQPMRAFLGQGLALDSGNVICVQRPGGTRTSLLAAAQSPGSLDPGRGSSSTATSSTVKDAGTSSMPPPSVPSSALTKAGTAGRAASSQEGTGVQAPAAKGPPVPKVGGVAAVQGPPTKPASDSAVMAKSRAKGSRSHHSPFKGIFLHRQNQWEGRRTWQRGRSAVSASFYCSYTRKGR